ncbi:hypothetical protein [Pedobacter frigidisoli]|uniref:hypothetical protein n=1 Tax=Pedobacter frigidisoli TaxID=2530455 RepID=UPI00292DC071|nr:hypothetical protein [Pedobacter frigidisoli]
MLKINDLKIKLVGGMLCLCFLLMSFGFSITGGEGKLAISNLVQVMTIVSLISAGFLRLFDLKILFMFFFLTFIGILNSFFCYNFPGKPLVIVFMLFSVAFLLLSYRFLTNCVSQKLFESTVRYLILLSVPIYLILGYLDYKEGLTMISYGMDDKSHATIILCFCSFISLTVFKKGAYLLSFFFIFLSIFTTSRLTVVFFPFLIFAMFYKIKRDSGIKMMVFVALFLLVPAVVYLIIILLKNSDSFLLFQRVSSSDSINDDSSSAHSMLIAKGIELKLESWNNFLFGISPGAFSDVLIRSDIDYSKIESIDPQFIQFARLGKAPVHSTHIAFFSEYSLPIFIFYVFGIFRITKELYLNKLFIDLLFWFGFLASITFYSSHNKMYFYVVLVYLCVRIFYKKEFSKETSSITEEIYA